MTIKDWPDGPRQGESLVSYPNGSSQHWEHDEKSHTLKVTYTAKDGHQQIDYSHPDLKDPNGWLDEHTDNRNPSNDSITDYPKTGKHTEGRTRRN